MALTLDRPASRDALRARARAAAPLGVLVVAGLLSLTFLAAVSDLVGRLG
jgi:hypothetical protein